MHSFVTAAVVLASACNIIAAPAGPSNSLLSRSPQEESEPCESEAPTPYPPPKGNGACENPRVRKEWRALTDVEKKDYIDAVLCLQQHPAITKEQFANNSGLNPINRYDDFHAVHNLQTPNIHFVGHFASWHRYMMHEYERTLRDVCGYKGSQPYWNWSLDAQPNNNLSMAIYDTDVFSPTVGFGGNGKYVELPEEVEGPFRAWGRSGGGCVQDGPFTVPNFHVNIGEKNGSSCLRRDFLPAVLHEDADPKQVQLVLDQPNYTKFARQLEGGPSFAITAIHAGGHFGVGGMLGQAGDAANSPGEPLFYMHHTMIDYVFWQWQQRDLENRLTDIGGPVHYLDFGGENVTLDFQIDLGAIAPPITLREALNTEGELFCYTYE